MRFLHIIGLGILLAFLSSCNSESYKNKLTDFMGVWASSNSELIITGKYRLLLSNVKQQYTATLLSIESNNDDLQLSTKAHFFADKSKQVLHYAAKHLDENRWIVNENYKSQWFSFQKAKIKKTFSGKKQMYFGGELICEILQDKNQMVVFDSGIADTLFLLEKINVQNNAQVASANQSNIGICLIEWQLGSHIKKSINYESITINTNRYSFYIGFGKQNDEKIFFARAATISSANKGMAYFQTFRMMSNTIEFTLWKPANLFEKVSKPQKISVVHLSHPKYEESQTGKYLYLHSFGNDWIKMIDNKNRFFIVEKPVVNNYSQTEYFTYYRAGSL